MEIDQTNTNDNFHMKKRFTGNLHRIIFWVIAGIAFAIGRRRGLVIFRT